MIEAIELTKSFGGQWYYASFTILDDKASSLNREFESQITKRNQFLDQWQWLAPAAMVHENFSSISQTDRASHLSFLQEIHNFHEELKMMYYTKIFNEGTFNTL